jgi:glutathione S-transferase
MLKLYGISTSRALRPLWMLEELGLEFDHEPLDFRGKALQTPDYLSLNPNGRIPTLVDGDLVLWESMAINLYLAKTYGADTGLWPESPAAQALAIQWSFWVMSEVERALLTVLEQRRVLPEPERDANKLARNQGALRAPFRVLDDVLAKRPYLVADRFTVADLNLAAVMSWAKPAKLDLSDWPNLRDWLDRCLKRPAFKRARQH